MTNFKLPYGKTDLEINIPAERITAVLSSRLHNYEVNQSPEELVSESLENPFGSPRLSQLAIGKDKVVIIASDHTRPVPSKIIIPQMLAEIRVGNPNAKIIILISTGCHRETTFEELEYKFGPEIMRNEKIVIHDCDAEKNLVKIGYLPSGGPLIINRAVVEADLVASEGFIEPHFFAGFSGGRKSIFPGVTSRISVLSNHNAQYINHPNSRTGIIEGNPIHEEMLFAARAARLEFICNVVINSNKNIIFSVAGDCDLAHVEGIKFLLHQCRVKSVPSDIVISTNGGYPMDQNIYQAVKGMTAAEATVKDGGVIIMIAKSDDGHGGKQFYKSFKNEKDLHKMTKEFLDTPRDKTIPDQWQSQIFARILQRAKVVYVSDAPNEMVRDLHMIPAHSIKEALMIAENILAKEDSKIAIIPNGISVIVE